MSPTTEVLHTPIRLSPTKQAVLTTPVDMDDEDVAKLRSFLTFWLNFTEGKLPEPGKSDGQESQQPAPIHEPDEGESPPA